MSNARYYARWAIYGFTFATPFALLTWCLPVDDAAPEPAQPHCELAAPDTDYVRSVRSVESRWIPPREALDGVRARMGRGR